MTVLQMFFGEQDIRRAVTLVFWTTAVLAIVGVVLVLRHTKGSLPNRFGWGFLKLFGAALLVASVLSYFEGRVTLAWYFLAGALALAVLTLWAPKPLKGKQKGVRKVLKFID